MKKVIISLSIVLVTIIPLVQAQVLSNHLIFKGIPIDGTLNEYVSKMEKSGFTHIGTEDRVALLKGDFASYKNSIIEVSTRKQKDLVSEITVIFPEHDTWSSLSDNYLSLKEMLTKKYGKPSTCIEKFQSSLPPADDQKKLYEVQFDRCKYQTSYKTENGHIHLSIDSDQAARCFVRLIYKDKINNDIVKVEAMNDL